MALREKKKHIRWWKKFVEMRQTAKGFEIPKSLWSQYKSHFRPVLRTENKKMKPTDNGSEMK